MIRNECDCAIYRILCAKRYHILERCGVVLIWPCATLRKTNYALLFIPIRMVAFFIFCVICILFEFFPASCTHKWLFIQKLLRAACVFCLIMRMLCCFCCFTEFESYCTPLDPCICQPITIFLFAPYDHPNLHMTKEELAASKHMAMLTVLILDMALILSLSMQFYAFANGLALGLGFTAFLLIMEYGKQIYEKEICKQWKTKK